MKKTKLKALLFCFIIGCVIAIPQKVKAAENTTVNISVQYGQTEARSILNMINEMRTSSTDAWYWNQDDTTKTVCSNLSKYTYDYDLERMAMKRAAEIALSYSHTRPDNTTCFTIYNEEKVNDRLSVGENIAAGQVTAESVNNAWREDAYGYSGQGHRRNMLSSDFNCIGIGHVYYNGRHYWVEEFAKRSNINTTGTGAVDETKTVPINVAQSNITGFSAVFDKKSYALRVGEKVSPKFTGSVIYIKESARPTADTPSISVEDSLVASYDGKQLTGIKEGTTSLKATLYGLSASSTPTVSVHDCNNHWDSGRVTIEPTCTKKGEKTFTCTICNNTNVKDIDPNGHDYAEEWTLDVAPTCEKEGTESRHCKFCEEKTDEKSVPALGHNWKDNEDGTAICTREGCSQTHTHVWGEGITTKEATCKADGEKSFQCTYGNCTAVKKEKIEKLEHDYKKTKTVPATCEEAGKIYYECSRCKEIKVEKNESDPALGHNWKDNEDGTAICTREGCGQTHTHVWDEGTTTKEATCEADGEKSFQCTYGNCTAVKKEKIEKLGHDYKETKTIPATCEEAGKIYYECSRCKAAKVGEDKSNPPLKHKNTEVRDAVKATCQTEGYTGDTYCKDCGIKLLSGKTIPLTAHVWDEGKVIKKATYTATGEVAYTCKVCGEKKKEEVPKLAYPKAGTLYTISGNKYKVVKAGAEVSFVQGRKNAKNITIPATIKVQGVTYKVVAIEAKAFNNNKKLAKITVGINIIRISNNAFFKCNNLKSVGMKTTLLTKKTAGKKAFTGANKKLVIKAPKKVKKVYTQIFKGIKVK